MNSKELFMKSFGELAENMVSAILKSQAEKYEEHALHMENTEDLRWELEKAKEREDFYEQELETANNEKLTLQASLDEIKGKLHALEQEKNKVIDWWVEECSIRRELQRKYEPEDEQQSPTTPTPDGG